MNQRDRLFKVAQKGAEPGALSQADFDRSRVLLTPETVTQIESAWGGFLVGPVLNGIECYCRLVVLRRRFPYLSPTQAEITAAEKRSKKLRRSMIQVLDLLVEDLSDPRLSIWFRHVNGSSFEGALERRGYLPSQKRGGRGGRPFAETPQCTAVRLASDTIFR
jgi:hypothetical protein